MSAEFLVTSFIVIVSPGTGVLTNPKEFTLHIFLSMLIVLLLPSTEGAGRRHRNWLAEGRRRLRLGTTVVLKLREAGPTRDGSSLKKRQRRPTESRPPHTTMGPRWTP